jgi:hypothetical protein
MWRPQLCLLRENPRNRLSEHKGNHKLKDDNCKLTLSLTFSSIRKGGKKKTGTKEANRKETRWRLIPLQLLKLQESIKFGRHSARVRGLNLRSELFCNNLITEPV